MDHQRPQMSVPAILTEVGFEPGAGYRVNTALPRTESLVALLLLSESRRQVVIIERLDGKWVLPTMRIESPWYPGQRRPERTLEVDGLAQLGIGRYAAQPADGGLPKECWITVTGVAATDAAGVITRTSADRHSAPVPNNGIFLNVLRGKWSERPEIVIQRTDRRVVHLIQPL